MTASDETDLIERLRALGEEQFYHEPATCHRLVNEAADENEALRKIISECATATGAGVAPTASLDFMRLLPAEIEASLSRLRGELDAAREALKQRDDLLMMATRFRFGDDLFVESRGPSQWVVFNGSSVLNTLGEWEYEPLPSSRSDAFRARTRRSFADAVTVARAALSERTT